VDDCSSKRWGLTRMKASHGEAQELSTPFKGPARTELIAFTNNAAEQSFLCLPEVCMSLCTVSVPGFWQLCNWARLRVEVCAQSSL